jgi:DNA processing protein
MNNKHIKLLALHALPGVGAVALRQVSQIPQFDQISIVDIGKFHKKVGTALAAPGALEECMAVAEKAMNRLNSLGARLICENDEEYPPLMLQAKARPYLISVIGSLRNHSNCVTVIGTRNPSEYGIHLASRAATLFAEYGWSVVSGLALGCDTVAHTKTLDAGGHTVAVLAHGLHTISPKGNTKLAERILDSGGALLSEFVLGESASPRNFVARDKTQAAMSKGVLMVESKQDGGSLNASRAAINLDRILAVPEFPESMGLASMEGAGGNVILTRGGSAERAELLGCAAEKLKNIYPIKDSDGFSKLEADLKSI